MKIKLYKTVGLEKRLVDFGVLAQTQKYKDAGYVVELADDNDVQRPYRVVAAEFKKLWYTLPAEEKRRLADLPTDTDMSIEGRLSSLKGEIATRKKRTITVVPRRVSRPSLMSRVKGFFNSLIPQMEVCYA